MYRPILWSWLIWEALTLILGWRSLSHRQIMNNYDMLSCFWSVVVTLHIIFVAYSEVPANEMSQRSCCYFPVGLTSQNLQIGSSFQQCGNPKWEWICGTPHHRIIRLVMADQLRMASVHGWSIDALDVITRCSNECGAPPVMNHLSWLIIMKKSISSDQAVTEQWLSSDQAVTHCNGSCPFRNQLLTQSWTASQHPSQQPSVLCQGSAVASSPTATPESRCGAPLGGQEWPNLLVMDWFDWVAMVG